MSTAPSVEATTDLAALWNEAIDSYQASIGLTIDALPKANNVGDIMVNVQAKENIFQRFRHDESKWDKFRTSVRKSLVMIENLGNIAASSASVAFPPSTAVFTAVQYLFSIAAKVSADYDKMTGFFEELEAHLGQVQILKDNVHCTPELGIALIEVFKSVLQLCGICGKYVRQKRIVKAFRNLGSGDDELEAAYTQFHKMIEREQGVVAFATFQAAKSLQTSLSHEFVRLEIREAAKDRKEKINKLSSQAFSEEQMRKHKGIAAKRSKGTCQWLLELDRFQQWLGEEQIHIIWCPGHRTGKSVMFSSIINHINHMSEGSDLGLAYIYCDYKDSRSFDGSELLSVMVRQLAERTECTPPDLEMLHRKAVKTKTDPTVDEWISLFKSFCRAFNKVYVLIDALDECPETKLGDLICLIKEFQPFVRLCITSRPHVDLRGAFPNVSQINVVASASDIKSYLRSKSKTHRRMSSFIARDSELENDILQVVTEKADGMFLLADLMFTHLCGQTNAKGVRRAMTELPSKLPDYYDQAMDRIEEGSEGDCLLMRRAFSYITYARRPLIMQELRHLLIVEVDDTDLSRDALPDTEIILGCSVGLIRVDGTSSTVGLVHYSLQQYLESRPDRLLPDTELDLATRCLSYLSFDVFNHGPCLDAGNLIKRLQEYQYLEYAAHHWGFHLRHCQHYSKLGLVHKYLNSRAKLSSAIQVLYTIPDSTMDWHTKFPRNYGALHAAAYWGFDELVPNILERDSDVNVQDSYGNTPLHLAAKGGHCSVLQLLLDRGADVEYKSARNETALHWGAMQGHETIVDLLLSKGAVVMSKDDEGWTALDWAIVKGHDSVVKMLLRNVEEQADPASKYKALYLAAEEGHEATIEVLLRNGADVNAKDELGSSVLDWAAAAGHEVTVKMLLQHGSALTSRDNYGNSVLHWAIRHVPVLKLLLAEDVDVNAENDNGQTPLCWAVQDDTEQAVRSLLDKKAAVNVRDQNGTTALHRATHKWRESIVHLLLEHGADPNAEDKDGWKPLHLAALKHYQGLVQLLTVGVPDAEEIMNWAKSQHEDVKKLHCFEEVAEAKAEGSTVVTGIRWAADRGNMGRLRVLLSNGANVNGKDAGGWTALHLAASAGHEQIVQYLLEKGAHVNSADHSGRTALHWAADRGRERIVPLLIKHGADINAVVHGRTPILLAAKLGRTTVIDVLVSEGADVHANDCHGRTVLHWVAIHGCKTHAQTLIARGIDHGAIDDWGKTALDYAIEKWDMDVVALLQDVALNNKRSNR